MARECTQAWGPSVSLFSPASDGSSDESDHAMKQSSPRPSIVASVPVSAQSTPSSVPRSSPKGPAVWWPRTANNKNHIFCVINVSFTRK